MNKFLLAELSKLGLEWSPVINIPKRNDIRLQENVGYIIQLSDHLLGLPKDDPLVINWNSGILPTTKYYKVNIEKLMGDRVRVTGIGFDIDTETNLNNTFFGWIPLSEMEVIKKL